MSYQEQQVITFSVVAILTFLIIGYAVTMTFGLSYLKKDTVSSVKIVEVHQPKVIHISKEPLPEPPEYVEKEPVIDEETYLLAQIINAEAGNQPYKGKIAVGNVIMNRIDHPKFPDTVEDVVYQRGQFSPVSNGTINNKPSDEAIQAAKDVMDGKRVVNENVLFFYNPDISTSRWIFTREVVIKIGEHAFAL